jgi:hypothetical protein
MSDTAFMQELRTKLGATRGESSVKQMMGTLKSINGGKPFGNLRFLHDEKAVMEVINSRSLLTRGSYFSTITNALATQGRTKKLRDSYAAKARETWTAIQTRDVHEKTAKQEENMIPMKEIHKRREELEEIVGTIGDEPTATERDYLTMWLLVCLYTEIQPRRNQDYAHMMVVPEMSNCEDEDCNYLVMADKQFVFNKYKTKRIYGRQVIDIPEDLMKHIMVYLRHHPHADAGVYDLIPGINKINGITRMLNKAFGKKIGATALRHIYLSDKYATVVQERQEDAAAMAHSVQVQTTYIKI